MPQSTMRAAVQASTPTSSPAVASNPALSALRGEIDAIDEQILRLLQDRQALSARAAASKAPSDLLKIRPDREDQVIGRLTALGNGFSPPLIERVWREILSDGLHRQSPFALAVWAGAGDEIALADAARKRFGRGPELQPHPTPQAALDRAAGSCDVAVVSLQGAWWPELRRRWPDLSAFAVLQGSDGRPAALALARLEPGALGDAPLISIQPKDTAGAEAICLAASADHVLGLHVQAPTPPEADVIGAACGWEANR